jgi:hypothetical protein
MSHILIGCKRHKGHPQTNIWQMWHIYGYKPDGSCAIMTANCEIFSYGYFSFELLSLLSSTFALLYGPCNHY